MEYSIEKQEGRPRKQDSTAWLTIAVFAVLLAIIFAVVIYSFYRDIKAPQVITRCAPGMCKFSVYTGVKTCPGDGDTEGVQILEGTEFCTTADYCQNQQYPCAVQANQQLNCAGVCDTPQCRCVANPSSGLVGI